MKYIQKNPPPKKLIEYRKKSSSSYSSMIKKPKLCRTVRRALLQEQGFICCYCGRRISIKDSQIEHFFAKGNPVYEEMQLDYETNLLACCDGGKAERSKKTINKNELYCEAVKDETILPINPLTKECENKFLFDENGEVIGLSVDANVTIKILNLNSPVIKNMRKYAIDNYKILPPSNWNDELQRLSQKNAKGYYEEFCFVLENYIKMYQILD